MAVRARKQSHPSLRWTVRVRFCRTTEAERHIVHSSSHLWRAIEILRCGRLASSDIDARDACFASASVEHRERHWRRQRRHAPLVKEDSLERIGLGAGATARWGAARDAMRLRLLLLVRLGGGWCC